MLKFIVLVCSIFIFNQNSIFAQTVKLNGFVTNSKLEPLSYATVQIKELQIGTKTNDKGEFEFEIEEGEYQIVVSLIGYKKQSITFYHKKANSIQRIILVENENDLNEIKIIGLKKDRAEEYIKNVIKNKSKITDAVQSYSAKIYIKATEETNNPLSEKQLKKLSDSAKIVLQNALPQMSLAEISLQLDYEYPNKTKEVRKGVKLRGKSESLFYLRTTEGDFSLYNNLIKVPALSASPMLSPISYSGLVAYKYKTKSIFKKTDYTIYTISFSPTSLGNALLEGEVEIVDTSWTIIKSKFNFPKFHMPEYNFFQVSQLYDFMDNKAWLLAEQEMTYKIKEGKSSSSGRTIVKYEDYKIDTLFSKKYFNRELSATATEAYERDSTFWNTMRKEALTENEVKFIIKSDSIERVQKSKPYLDSIDKRLNRITIPRLLFTGQEHYNRKREENYYFSPLVSMIRPFFPGGTRIAFGGLYSRELPSKKRVSLSGEINYGIRNKDFQGALNFTHLYNPFSRGTYTIGTGRSFDFIYAGDAFINLFRRGNFYIKNTFEIQHSLELRNGLVLRNFFEFAERQSIDQLQFGRQLDSVYTINNEPVTFKPYNVFYISARLEYTPFQMYIREPLQKIILGSNYPTAYLFWRKGIPNILKSEVNFDYIEVGFKQKLKLGLAGIMNYRIFSGDFINQKDLKFIDYKFIRRGDPYFFNNPMFGFQSMDSSFAVFKRFYEGHVLHEFNGAILNKVPLLKKLNLLEIVGGGFMILPERKLKYLEAYAGIEKIIPIWREKFKVGFFVVGSAANKYNNPFQIKFGLNQFNKQKNSWY